MSNTEFSTAFGAGAKNPAAIIQALEDRVVYVVKDGESYSTLTPGNVTYIAYGGRIFRYDSTDSTTAADGTTCLVTADGKRFKADGFGGAQLRFFSVISRTLTTPPGSPTVGQQWIVGVGATGAWAAHDNQIAVWTTRGWVFVVPNTYDMANVVAEAQIYNFGVSNTWVSGIPASTIAANSISPTALKYGRFGLTVINQTTNAPPGSPSDGDCYIIGPSPTGAWSGNARNIANFESGAWVIYSAYNGAQVYDASQNAEYVYRSGVTSWVSLLSGYSQIADMQSVATAGSVTTSASGTSYTYSATVAPTTSQNGAVLPGLSVSYAQKKPSATLEIEVGMAWYTSSAAETYCLGLFVDGAANASDWIPLGAAPTTLATALATNWTFLVQGPADTANHTYAIRAVCITSVGARTLQVSRQRLNIRELS